mgnify:CR=1 FL=1
MRPAEVTDELIIKAGTELEAAGTRVNGSALRRAIGAGTPARMIEVWKAHKGGNAKPAEEVEVSLPVELEDALKQYNDQIAASLRMIVSNLHRVSLRTAEMRVAEVTRKAAQEQADYEAELKLASDLIENADMSSASLREELAATRDQLTQKTAELAQLAERLEHSRSELQETKEANRQLRQQADDSRQQAEELRRALDTANQEHAQAQGRSEAELATEQDKRKEAEKLLGQVRITCDALSEQMNAKTAELASANAKIKGLNERIVDLNLLTEEQRSSLHNTRQAVIRLERQNDDMAAELKTLRAAQIPANPPANN